MKVFKLSGTFCLLFASLIMFSCGGGGGGGDSSSSDSTGTLSMSLTDEPASAYSAFYITIDDIQVHLTGNENDDNNWKSVGTPTLPKTFNLNDLTAGVREEIGLADLPSGNYTQMRLIIGDTPDNGINTEGESHESTGFANYVIDKNGDYHELKIPSGYQTGFKIVHGFSISAEQTTELLLDFVASQSVVIAGNSGKWTLKPTIKVGDLAELSIIRGKVVDADSAGINNVTVSVQKFNENISNDATNAQDRVVVQTSTFSVPNPDTTDHEDGYFAIFVNPGEYNLVFYKGGLLPEVIKVHIAEKETLTFLNETVSDAPDSVIKLFSANPIRDVTGAVDINGADEEKYSTLSFRQEAVTSLCVGYDESFVCPSETTIEVTSVNVQNGAGGATYTIEKLPAGDDGQYDLVAWTPWSNEYGTETRNVVILEHDGQESTPQTHEIETITLYQKSGYKISWRD